MAFSNNRTVIAINKEVTEGTLILPDAAGDFIPVREGFDLTVDFQDLTNEELAASIGAAKVIQGLENVDLTLPVYMKHSGTEGTAPAYGPLWESLFGAAVATNSTERAATSGSSVSAIILAAGGSDFARGKAVLVKDGVNGYSIRPVHSVSSNTLTLGFTLSAAPASGVSMGKCIHYAPANSGHAAISGVIYRGNGCDVEAASGLKVNQGTIKFAAGQLIEVDFQMKGLKGFYNPIEITSSTKYIDWVDDGGTYAAAVAVQVYRDPHELASALQTAMNAVNAAVTVTVTYSNSTGYFTIAASGSVLTIKWNTGANTANSIATKVGFTTAADSSSALTYTSPTAYTLIAGYTPSYDAADPLVAKSNQVFVGDSTDSTCFSASSVEVTISNELKDIDNVCADSGRSGTLAQKRRVTAKIMAELGSYDVDKWKRFRSNADTRMMYAFGDKVGGQWVAGKSGCLYFASCVISNFKVENDGGLVRMSLDITGYIDSSGNGEVYLNFL